MNNILKRLAANMHPVDSIVAAALIAVCAWLWWWTFSFDAANPLLAQGLTPTLFPRLILAGIVLLAALLPFEHSQAKRGLQKLDDERGEPVPNATRVAIAAIFIVAVLAPFVGTVVMILLVCLFMPMIWGERRIVVVFVFALTAATLVVTLFAVVFGVPMDPGVFGIRFPV